MDEYWFRLLRHWLGFPAIAFFGSWLSNTVLVPRGIDLPSWVWPVLGLGYFLSLGFYQCPRCGKPIDSPGAKDKRNARSFNYHPEDTCPRCLRTRRGVRKFQYFLKREPWDGVRHDKS